MRNPRKNVARCYVLDSPHGAVQGDESSDAALPALKLRMVVSEGTEVGVPLMVGEMPLAILCFWLSATGDDGLRQ